MADTEIVITILGKDMTTSALRSVSTNLRSMGREISQVGLRLTALTTLPLILLGKNMMTFGAQASKGLAELQGAVDKAIDAVARAQTPAAKMAATQDWLDAKAALDAYSPALKKAADAYNEMNKAIKPVNDALEDAKATLLQGLVPVVQQLAPLLKDAATWVANLATSFAALPVGTKDAILAVVGVVAMIGPALLIFGQTVTVLGSLVGIFEKLAIMDQAFAAGSPAVISALRGIGAAGWAALGPVLAIVGAIGLLVKVITDNWNLISAAIAILTGGDLSKIKPDTGTFSVMRLLPNTVGNVMFPGQYKAAGGPVGPGSYVVGERGPEILNMGGNGYITPNDRMGGGSLTINFPAASLQTKEDIMGMLKPYLDRWSKARA